MGGGFFALAFLLACAAPAAAQPKHKIEATDSQAVVATITYEIKTTNFAVARWLVFMPEPPELPGQTKVKTTAEPAGKVVADKSAIARPVRFVDTAVANPVAGAKLALKLEVQATLRARKLLPLEAGEKAPKVPPLTAAEQKYYLAPSETIDFDSKTFQGWLDQKKLKAKKDEPPLELSARVLEVIRSGVHYRFNLGDDRKASVACARSSTDGAGMAFLFVAAMRANKVPARALIGRLAEPRKADAKPADFEYDRPYVTAEVYVAGVGWVPVSPVAANMDKEPPVTQFIGNDPGDLLVLHVDPDLRLPYPNGEKTALLQLTPHYQAFGKGAFDGVFGPAGWELKATPIKK